MTVAHTAEKAGNSRPMGWVARAGLVARAAVYLIMGWLAVSVALGARAHVDQRAVLVEVARQPLGQGLVIALAVGFAAYALWRLSEVFTGPSGEPDGVFPRLASLGRAFAYGFLCLTAVSVLSRPGGTQSGQQEQLAQSLMPSAAGRIAVAAAGLVLVGVGIYQVHQGLTTAFLRYFPYLPPGHRTAVAWLGRIGTTARGVVFVLAGALVVVAAWRVDPQQAGGIDDAVHSLLGLPFGPAMVYGLGAGLILFGIYGLAEAAWRQVPDDEVST